MNLKLKSSHTRSFCGPYDKKVAERLRKYIFSVGNTIDPAEGYRNFRGRDPKVEALMKKRGFGS